MFKKDLLTVHDKAIACLEENLKDTSEIISVATKDASADQILVMVYAYKEAGIITKSESMEYSRKAMALKSDFKDRQELLEPELFGLNPDGTATETFTVKRKSR